MWGEKLLNNRVEHKMTKKRGIILSARNGIMEISFSGMIQKFSYPAAFATILTLEDEELQEGILASALDARFEDFIQTYSHSVIREITYLRKTGGKKYRMIDGERLVFGKNDYIYAFDTDTEMHFPDGTPIKIRIGEYFGKAKIMSCEEFVVVIQADEYLGETVETIEFTAEQWMLLEALHDRLAELDFDNNKTAYQLACKGRTKINEGSILQSGQETAQRKAADDDITFIWGPPGTGKTHTLSNIALDAMEMGNRVLMLSYSNVSVDGALLGVAKKSDFEVGQVVRYGYPRMKEVIESPSLTSYKVILQQNPELAEEYNELLAKKRKLSRKDPERLLLNKRINAIRSKLIEREKELVQSAAFVATTVSKAIIDKTIYEQSFDYVIFDEASMAYVPQIVFSAGLAKSHFVCLGDFKQLPAIVQNPEEIRLTEDIFDYTGITEAVAKGCGHEWLVMLNKQYRMHPDISDFVSENMYQGLLSTAPQIIEERQLIADCEPMPGAAIGMLDLSYMYSVCIKTMDNSRINLMSALICVRTAEMYLNKYKVGIITPYSAQSRLILSMIRDLQERNENFNGVTSATVHQFQGSEQPVIIYDAVDCFRIPYPGVLLSSTKNNTANRLFNVALTRAKGKIILVTNKDYMFRKKINRNLLFTKAMRLTEQIQTCISGDELIDNLETDMEERDQEVLLSDRDDSWKLFMEDIMSAEKDIHIDIPGLLDEDDEAIEELAKELKKQREDGKKVRIRIQESLSIPKYLQKFAKEDYYVTNPVVIIDKKVIWFGQPLCAADFITEGELLPTETFPCLRFEGKHTARALKAFLEI